MGRKEVVNLSRFLLFEQEGDSEADSHGKTVLDYDDQDYAFDDADDAQSCTSDVGWYGKSRDPHIEISKQKVFSKTHFADGDDGIRNDMHAIGSYHHHYMKNMKMG